MTVTPLTDDEYRRFREWLVEEYGLHFGPAKRDILRSRLDPRRTELGFDSFEQLFFHLKFHPEGVQERNRLLPHLTNNESYFFRERGQLDVLREEVLPELVERRKQEGRKELRLLSAGCAGGEEPYTLAMIVRESRSIPANFAVRITGADLDPSALERARTARYTDHAFRGVSPEVRDRHFTPIDGRWQLEEPIRSAVDFRGANLVDPDWARALPAQDVIFCRNVLIYFDEKRMKQAVEGLYNALAPGGYLFLGHAESLSRIPTRLEPVRRPGAIFYRRPEA